MDLNELLSEDESVDYSTPRQPLQPTVQVQNQVQQTPDFDDTSVSNPETVTDSSLDSSSIEVLQPDTGLRFHCPSILHKGNLLQFLQLLEQMLQCHTMTILLQTMRR